MENRINELENILPIIKERLDSLINNIASLRQDITDEKELIIALKIIKLEKEIENNTLE